MYPPSVAYCAKMSFRREDQQTVRDATDDILDITKRLIQRLSSLEKRVAAMKRGDGLARHRRRVMEKEHDGADGREHGGDGKDASETGKD